MIVARLSLHKDLQDHAGLFFLKVYRKSTAKYSS